MVVSVDCVCSWAKFHLAALLHQWISHNHTLCGELLDVLPCSDGSNVLMFPLFLIFVNIKGLSCRLQMNHLIRHP
jgi:hypothetical protein